MFGNDKKIRHSFDKVRREFEEHLDSINANTSEIQENRAMMLELNERLCKLGDQIADIKLMLEDSEPDAGFRDDIELSLREQEVFLAMYTAPDLVTYADVARMLTLPVQLIADVVDQLISKGVPVLKQRNERDQTFLTLERAFVEKQSKQNLLGIDENLSKQISKDFQMSLFD